jgi:hypothetical protein
MYKHSQLGLGTVSAVVDCWRGRPGSRSTPRPPPTKVIWGDRCDCLGEFERPRITTPAVQLQFVGEFARTLQTTVRDDLASRTTGFEWVEEYDVGGTPVDVAGVSAERDGDSVTDDEAANVLVAVELEVRRADPANNTVTLLRALENGALDRFDRVVVCQVFTAYYDLVNGGVSTKRENATFVGRLAADAYEGVVYHAVDLPVDPPKAGSEPPEGWEAAVEAAVGAVERAVRGAVDSDRTAADGDGSD